MKKCCIDCKHCEVCPIIIAWVEATESPIQVFGFHCSEYEERKRPTRKEE